MQELREKIASSRLPAADWDESKAHRAILDILSNRRTELKNLYKNAYDAYRNRYHEREAFSAGKKAREEGQRREEEYCRREEELLAAIFGKKDFSR